MIKLKASLESYTQTTTLEDVCKTVHGIMRQFNLSIGDRSLTSWEETSESVKKSTREGVRRHLFDPELTPEDTHNEWMAERKQEGWSCGEEKDEDAKTHPCMVPYEELSIEHRLKDHLFANVISAYREALIEHKLMELADDEDS